MSGDNGLWQVILILVALPVPALIVWAFRAFRERRNRKRQRDTPGHIPVDPA